MMNFGRLGYDKVHSHVEMALVYVSDYMASDIYLGGQNRMHLRDLQPTLSSRHPCTHHGGIELEQFF